MKPINKIVVHRHGNYWVMSEVFVRRRGDFYATKKAVLIQAEDRAKWLGVEVEVEK